MIEDIQPIQVTTTKRIMRTKGHKIFSEEESNIFPLVYPKCKISPDNNDTFWYKNTRLVML